MNFINTACTKLFLCLLILLFSHQNLASQKPSEEFRILFYIDSTGNLNAGEVAEKFGNNEGYLLSSAEMRYRLSSQVNYWMFLKPESGELSEDYVFSIKDRLSRVEVYDYPYTERSGIAGMTIPGGEKNLPGDKLMLNRNSESFLIKIENRLRASVSLNALRIVPYSIYITGRERTNLVQGILHGIFALILIYNIILFILVKKRIHLYYVLYILLNALLLSSSHEFSERYIFPHNAELNRLLLSFQILGIFFYLLFLRSAMLNHCSGYTPEKDRRLLRPFAFIMLIINAIVGITIIYRLDLFTISSRLSNLMVSFFCIILFISFYKESDRFLRIVMLGTILVIIMGYVNILVSIFHKQTDMYYVAGLLSELLLLTYALNVTYFKNQFEVENRNRDLEYQTEIKDRELLNKALQLSSKEKVISSLKEKLKNLGVAENENNQVYSELEMSDRIEKILWSEFEKHFNSIHPEFYKNIASDYPNLSQNEIRLCAFLLLNLNTKEIAAITKKSAHSIETMRSRIRQKLNLDRDTSLNNYLLQQY